MHGQAGYTILELIVAGTLAAVVMGLASPALSELRNHFQLEGISRQISMEISKARMQAIAQNRTIRINFPDTHSYEVQSSEDGVQFQTIGETIQLPTGVTAVVTAVPQFNRQGTAPWSSRVLILSPVGVVGLVTNLIGKTSRVSLSVQL